MLRYYVYTLADADGVVFYVGKGQRSRWRDHEKEAKTECACIRCERIRSIWSAEREVVRTKVYETDDETLALKHEQNLIKKIGRANLCNRSDGGEGVTRTQKAIISAKEFRKKEMARIERIVSKVKRGNKTRKREELMQEFYRRDRLAAELAERIEADVQYSIEALRSQGIEPNINALYRDYEWLSIETPKKWWP